MSGNREYKNDVFCMLMEEPEHALSVYNALNGSDYKDPSVVEILKLESGVQLSIRNDASFLIDNYLNLYEHQSRPNPNMPLRFLIYVTELFQSIIKNRDLFSTRLLKIPTPRFIVFYNGAEERQEIEYLKLSDAFEHPMEMPELELTCKVYNINRGNNENLLKKCNVLDEYATFVERVRFYEGQYPLSAALDRAIESCIADNVLRKFLREHRGEVKRVMTLDYTFERRLQLAKEENQEILEQLAEEKAQLKNEKVQLSNKNAQLSSKN
ncbi:MAG: hypothetical protein LUB60_01310, partial [Clostridiales bacterium]|nr:hypothetical protein [Clostridiales bacterium]